MPKHEQASGRTSIPLSPSTKAKLESIKLSQGDETWDHQLGRLYRLAKAAEAKGILAELLA